MFKFIGAVIGGLVAFDLISLLVWPFIILACIATLGHGLMTSWPWVCGVIGYAVILALIVKLLRSSTGKTGILLVGTAVVGGFFFFDNKFTWSTASVAVLAMVFSFAVGSSAHSHWRVKALGFLAAIQLFWIVPLTVMIISIQHGVYNMLHLIATVMGMIATFLVADQ